MDSDYRSGVSSSAGRGEAPPRSSFFQQLTGVGKREKMKRAQLRRLSRQHEREGHVFSKEQRKEEKKFGESLEERRKRFFLDSGLPQFINRSPSDEERKDWRLARVVERYETEEKVMKEDFKERKRKSERAFEKKYEKEKTQLFKKFRKQGPGGFTESRGPRPVLYQMFGVNPRSSDPRAGKTTLSI